jgi:hypothetical protein
MLTLAQFKEMAAAYGADLERWPEELRREAHRLLRDSAAARAALVDEREVDSALKQASARADARRVSAGGPDAALERLRTRVVAHLASSTAGRGRGAAWLERLRALHMSRRRWLAVATLSGAAAVTGLLLGALYPWPASSPDLVSMLQMSSLSLWGD